MNTTQSYKIPEPLTLEVMRQAIEALPLSPKLEKIRMNKRVFKELKKATKQTPHPSGYGYVGALYGLPIEIKPYSRKVEIIES